MSLKRNACAVDFFVFFFHMQMWTKAPFLAPMRGEYEELWRPAVVVQGHGDRERSVVHYKRIATMKIQEQ